MRKLNVTVVAGLVVALLGAVLVYLYGHNIDKKVADGRKTKSVYVAAQSLAIGTRGSDLTSSDVVKKDVPADYLPEGALGDLKDIKDDVLLGPIPKDGYIVRSMFGQPSSATAVKPSKGHLATAVGVDLTPGVARYIAPGSFVDVFVTYSSYAAKPQAISEARTKLFLSGVRVLSVTVADTPKPASSTGSSSSSSGDTSSDTGSSVSTSQVVAVLDLTPTQAEQAVNAIELGKVYLGLSAVGGSTPETHKTESGVTPNDVVQSNR